MIALITAVCLTLFGSGGLDVIYTVHFDGCIAKSTADYAVVRVYSNGNNLEWTSANLTPGSNYCSPSLGNLSWGNSNDPFKVTCTIVEGQSITVRTVTGLYFTANFHLEPGWQWICTNHF
ncbi:MAG: hypothetical protein KAS73_10790 [Candidatus Sabulitectum sp.]|nr:hypothetical protein [Candidatus Sabulitectum sp.]